MICNKYKLNNDEVILLYTKLDKIEQPKIFDALQIQLIEENVDITVSISVYKVCNINSDPITTKANYIGIKNGILKSSEKRIGAPVA